MTSSSMVSPEVALTVRTGSVMTNYHDVGEGAPVLLLHGSGPGVSAYANWRLQIQDFSRDFRVLAPDLAGFGYTEVPSGTVFVKELWNQQILDFLDALGLEAVHLVGNSFGGSLALELAARHPSRVGRLVLMGSVGVPFDLTVGLDAVWGYEPSRESMASLMRETFAYDGSLVADDLIESRYVASLRTQENFRAMFPAPRQRWVHALALEEEAIRSISHRTLLIHGRDDKVIPLESSIQLHEWIDDSELHVFGRCGHWTQIEHAVAFGGLVRRFLR